MGWFAMTSTSSGCSRVGSLDTALKGVTTRTRAPLPDALAPSAAPSSLVAAITAWFNQEAAGRS